jgi:Cu+-exporting ATPase
MHPEIVRDAPGNCPICGMALEPRTVTLDDVENVHLKDVTRRFWVSVALSLPLVVLAMAEMVGGTAVRHAIPEALFAWGQLALATPVVLWGGWASRWPTCSVYSRCCSPGRCPRRLRRTAWRRSISRRPR